MKNNPILTFENGADSVTGANFRLSVSGKNILVDCGLVQGSSESDEINRKPFSYKPEEVDALFVTHSHIDHIGRIPKLVRDGFRGDIYSTVATKEISSVMFEDALGIMEHEKEEKGAEPLWEEKDVSRAISLWQTLDYSVKHSVFGGLINVVLRDAGHVLGSATVEIEYDTGDRLERIVFADDLGNSPAPLLRAPEKITNADFMVIDSVYGDREHESPQNRDEKFRRIVQESVSAGGALVIPAFSLARTQIILHELNKMVEEGLISKIPVFLDSPLAIKLTRIYERSFEQFKDGIKGEIKEDPDGIFRFPNLTMTERVPDSKAIEDAPSPKIIIAGSGMSTGGRVLHHEIDYLPDPKSTILLVGYQAEGTLGRMIEEGEKEVEIFGKTFPVKAKVEKIEGYSSHADQKQLVEFIGASKKTLKKVFLAMGEQEARKALKETVEKLGVSVYLPEKGESVELK